MDPFSTSKIVAFIQSRLKLSTDKASSRDKELKNLLDKADNHIKSDHVRRFQREANDKLVGNVDPSYGKTKNKLSPASTSYLVQIIFDELLGPKEVSCACPVGTGLICSHGVTLMMFAQKMLSRTDFTSVWNRTKKTKGVGNTKINDIWQGRRSQVLKSPVTAIDRPIMLQACDRVKQFGLYWLLDKNEVTGDFTHDSVSMRAWMTSLDYLNATDKKKWLICKLQMTKEAIIDIQKKTIGQGVNSLWLTIREGRITASVFGIVIRSIERTIDTNMYAFSETLMKTLSRTVKLDKVKAISWGISHEAEAISEYEKETSRKVKRTGIHFLECGYIGASPDGIVDDQTIIEVKCPYSLRNMSLIEARNSKFFCLKVNSQGDYFLDQNHAYFHQVQGCLAITGRNTCDFVYWTPLWLLIVPIPRDVTWSDYIYVMKSFYEEIFLEYLMSMQ